MANIQLEITTPEKLSFKGEVDELVAPGDFGLMGVKPGHAPLLCTMRPGILTAYVQGKPTLFVLGGGFMEISDNHVRILADTADCEEDIDLERAKVALEDATEALKHLTVGTSEYKYQKLRRKRAELRIRVATQTAKG